MERATRRNCESRGGRRVSGKLEGIEKTDINEYVIASQSPLREHSKKLYKKRLKKDVKKSSFPDRAIDKWNALPEQVVCNLFNLYMRKQLKGKKKKKIQAKKKKEKAATRCS